MNVVIAFIELLGALAWPVGVVILALIFEEKIKELMGRASKISTFGATIDFHLLRQFHVEDVQEPDVAEWLEDTIDNYPRAAIIDAWLRVESTARQILDENEIQNVGMPWVGVIRALSQHGLLHGNLDELLPQLRTLGNQVAHELNAPIDSGDAGEYVAVAQHAIDLLQTNAHTKPS